MEPRFGADFSSVRVHTDSTAVQMNKELGAQAFTHGSDIYYGTGKSPDKNELTAHELTHVVQQTGGLNHKVELQQKCDTCAIEEEKLQAKELHESSPVLSFNEDETGAATQAVDRGQAIKQPTTDSGKNKSDAEQAMRNVDRGKFEAKKNQVLAQKQPQIEQTHQHLPQVEKAAQQAASETQKPSTPSAQAASQESPKHDRVDAGASATADHAAHVTDQALVQIDTPPVPAALPDVISPEPVAPVTPVGTPVPEDPEGEAAIAHVAQQAQALRQGGQQLLAHAAEIQGNAQILTGNIQLIKQGVNQADQGIAKSTEHLQFRQETVGKAKQALQVSEQKAAKVAAEAPGFTEKASQGQEKSSPMASKASGLAGENAAKTPSDPEAAGKSQEQGQKLNKVASDTTKVDEAFTQTKAKAANLAEEAAQATAKNTQTKSKVQTMEQTLGQTKERLSQMKAQNTQAKTQLQTLENQPGQMVKQASEMREKGQAPIQASTEIEKQLHQVQAEYQQAISNLPGTDRTQDAGAVQADAGAIQMSPAEGRYENRENIDLVGWLSKKSPSLTGIDQVSEEKKQAAIAAAQAKRKNQVDQINAKATQGFENLSAGQKMGIALNLMGQNLSSSLSNMQWPDWKHLALGLIDPRGPLMGVVSGLSQILSGGANLLSAEQWSKDPLGNFLKSAADIATGLTVIFGSITALAGLIIAICSAATILTLGAAAPVTGPIIAFCATVMTTVGGWTFYTGLIAAGLHSLVFIKNLVDAATAKTAEDLQNQSDQMTQDVTNAGGALLQAGMGKLAQVGGRQLQSGIAAEGGGVRFAAKMGAEGLPNRVVTGVKEAGGVGAYARGVAGSVGRDVAGAARGIGTAIEEQGLGGFARQTGAKAWSGVKGAARETWEGLTGNGESPVPGREGFSRDFLVGKDIPEGGLTTAANETRAATTKKLIEEMRGRGEIPPATEPKVPASESPSEAEVKPSSDLPVTSRDKEVLENTAPKQGKDLTTTELDTELSLADKAKSKPSDNPDFTEQKELPNGHEWKRREQDGAWCRFSPGEGDPCVPSLERPSKRQKTQGEQLAEERGWPTEAPEGYVWYDDSGTPRLRNKPGNDGPVIEYKPDTGTFVEKPGNPKPDFKAVEADKSKLSHSELENKDVERLKQLEAERKSAQGSKHKAGDEGDKTAESKHHGEMVRASEELGEASTEAVVRKVTPNAERLDAKLPGGQKSGEFDSIYKDGDDVYIYESKGAGSQRGSRETAQGKRAEQGTPLYRDDIVDNMQKKINEHKRSSAYRDDPTFKQEIDKLQLTVDEIQVAKDKGKLHYRQVTQKVDKNGVLRSEIEVVTFGD
jgi:hypothetical protein